MIIFGVVFLILGSFIGYYFGNKMADTGNNETNNTTEEKEETDKEETDAKEDEDKEENDVEKTEDDNVISQELLKDLEKKAELSKYLALDIIFDKEIANVGMSNVLIYNDDESTHMYAAIATYEYYLYKTGKTAEKWTSKKASDGPCYEDGQNGYCYVIDKNEMEKYDKMFFNFGEDIFDGDGYVLLKGDKFYVTDMPYLGGNLSVGTVSAVSATKNIDDSISYVVNYNVEVNDKPGESVDVKYTFKPNDNGDYYLYMVTRV